MFGSRRRIRSISPLTGTTGSSTPVHARVSATHGPVARTSASQGCSPEDVRTTETRHRHRRSGGRGLQELGAGALRGAAMAT
jgi:hypothetical protein